MVYFLYGLFFLSCFVLIAAVLLQPGKTDAGALFTSNVSSSAMSPRGTATVLSKITIAAASMFMLSALLLAMPALTGNVSVLNSIPETATEVPASIDANTTEANSNSATSSDTNSNTVSSADANSNSAVSEEDAPASSDAPANK